MKKCMITLAILIVMLFSFSMIAVAKTYDVVLIHGLTNKHQWSDAFLNQIAATWGSGNVYVIFTNESTRVWTRTINGRVIYFCGENDYSGGDDYISVQSGLVHQKIELLRASYGLSYNFNIIAHSMGGLVARHYIATHAYRVAGLVTLGTPHLGSQLANNFEWAGFFVGATNAISDLRTSFVQNTFNVAYPISAARLYSGGTITTIEGDADGWDCWGWGGELQMGWDWLITFYWRDSDGLVPNGYARISGTVAGPKFWDYDHMELVTQTSVATSAASYLR
jgi:pimeloyl-ACP methyl ester carboxylesterase